MHIAFLTPEYPHPKIKNTAGLGTSIKNLAIALVKNYHKVTVFVYSQTNNEVFTDEGVEIHTIAFKKYPVLSWYLYRKEIEKYINDTIQKNSIQVIEAPDWTGITALMKFQVPLVIRLHGSDTYFCHLENRKQKLKNFYFEKIALKSADKLVAVSKFTAHLTKELFNLKNEIKVIYNGIDVNKFIADSGTYEKDTLLYFGSMIRKKGLLELAGIFNEVVKQKPQVKLKLIGKDVVDSLENESTSQLFFKLLSEQAKKQVEYIPEVPYNEIKLHIAKASVVVLPSFAEAFPMTWLEAMAMGKALVTSNIGWANELMINGETGFMEDPKNHKEYASKILKLLNDSELNSKFGKSAKKRIYEKFSQKVIVKKNIDYFAKIINEKP
ncbi:glycosyltransferase family 4 protein [Lutibacter sp. B1]|uniref:glycosyltransferase family 4 protein n=1 Tax=Lutibacter sp. B1 TaxID=2725996 RepID=UPI0014565705|nr:glycosyltransferase family 4 protein [Lutibacter sp. B1]NLP58153.1 glycosyltransferase family 4 protein [Lutibacter sp. B1]